MLDPAADTLARLIALRRLQGEAALSLDAYDRWGRGSRFDEQEQFEALAAQRPATDVAIRDLVVELRDANPEALDAVIDGQLQLLDAFVATLPDDGVERSVALEERAGWEAVRLGECDRVRQNTHYVQQDAALFERIFGFSPRKPGQPLE